jgi:hypothetical protein
MMTNFEWCVQYADGTLKCYPYEVPPWVVEGGLPPDDHPEWVVVGQQQEDVAQGPSPDPWLDIQTVVMIDALARHLNDESVKAQIDSAVDACIVVLNGATPAQVTLRRFAAG